MRKYQVVGIGNAIVDVIAQCDDTFLDHMGIEKGIMQLIERDRAETLFAAMEERTQAPGGSVGNTIAGLGNMGLSTAFIGRVRDDALGRFYEAALNAEGTDFPNPPVKGADLPSSRSMIFVPPEPRGSCSRFGAFWRYYITFISLVLSIARNFLEFHNFVTIYTFADSRTSRKIDRYPAIA